MLIPGGSYCKPMILLGNDQKEDVRILLLPAPPRSKARVLRKIVSKPSAPQATLAAMGLYLGLDLSTQSLSAMIIDTQSGRVVLDESVNFGESLPQYRSPSGVLSPG
jgi:hypothetical protein